MSAFLAAPTRTIYLTHSKYNGVQPGFRGDYKCRGSIVGVCNEMERRPSAFTPTAESLAVWLGMSLRKLIATKTGNAHLCDCTYFFPDSRLPCWVLVQFCIEPVPRMYRPTVTPVT